MRECQRIAILFHETTTPKEMRNYRAWHLAQVWRKWGLDVQLLRGAEESIAADLIIPQIDLSVVPRQYQFLQGSKAVVLNRDVVDIRKRTFSRNLVSQTDDYDGPVIIKTDANSGGKPENLVLRRSLWYRRGAFLAGEYLRVMKQFLSTFSLERLAYTRTLYSDSYPVYPSRDQVPQGVFENPYLVVERFLPETHGPFYYSRSYSFLGDEGVGVRLRSKNPVVKNAVVPGGLEFISVDESIVAARKALGFDYGKFDYVLHDGEPVLLDINKTPFPGTPYPPEMQQEIAAQLAKGIGAWFSTY